MPVTDNSKALRRNLARIIQLCQKALKGNMPELRRFIISGSPIGDRPGHAGTFKRSWTGITYETKGASFGNPQIYARALEKGSVPGKSPWSSVGPRTLSYQGNIFSSQAPGGVLIEPLNQQPQVVDDFIQGIADAIMKGLDV